MSATIGFRPTDEDLRILDAAAGEGESTSEVIRRALRLLDREAWMQKARVDAERLADEDLGEEPDTW